MKRFLVFTILLIVAVGGCSTGSEQRNTVSNTPASSRNSEDAELQVVGRVLLNDLVIGQTYCVVNAEYGNLGDFVVAGPSRIWTSPQNEVTNQWPTIVVPIQEGAGSWITSYDVVFASDAGLAAYGSGMWNEVNQTFLGACSEDELVI